MSGATAGATGMCCSNEKNQFKLDLLQSVIPNDGPIATFGPLDDNSCIIIKLPKNRPVRLLSDAYYLALESFAQQASTEVESSSSQPYVIIIGVLAVLLLLFIILSIVGFVRK